MDFSYAHLDHLQFLLLHSPLLTWYKRPKGQLHVWFRTGEGYVPNSFYVWYQKEKKMCPDYWTIDSLNWDSVEARWETLGILILECL